MTEKLNIRVRHKEAMENAQQALVAKEKGDNILASKLYLKAFEIEKEVALSLENDIENEPTRSVIFRSAASLANICGFYDDAKELIKKGLSGNPQKDIASEIKDLFNQIAYLSPWKEDPEITLYKRNLEYFSKPLNESSKFMEDSKYSSPLEKNIGILLDNLILIEGITNYTLCYLINDKRIMYSRTLSSYLPFLDSNKFIRVHKNYLVNIGFISSFNNDELIMSNDVHITISRRRKKDILDKISNYIAQKENFLNIVSDVHI